MDLREILQKVVSEYKTQYEYGFTKFEMEEVKSAVKEHYPNFNEEKYNSCFYGNTCMFIDGNIITYHTDLITALLCGIENRNMKNYEFD